MKWLERPSDKKITTKPYPPKNTKIELSDNSRKILEKRYLKKGTDGTPDESVEELFTRVSRTVSGPDEPYMDRKLSEIQFYNLLSTKKFFPNSPTFTGAGTPLGQLAACFVLPISDDLGREGDGIFSTLKVAALIQQVGGGNGFSFSDIRPRGARVSTSGGYATGPVGFLSVYDKAFGEVAQGGIRRGANMAVLKVDHPDIREFIKCKSDEGEISNFNISVAITDNFMKAVKEDRTYDLVDPNTKEVAESPRARDIFDMIVEYAHKNGEPGVLFIDKANEENPVPHLYELKATNPCGEQWLGPYENCCLGSINLVKHLDDKGSLDWEMLESSVRLSTRFLDNVVSANQYVPSVPLLKEAAEDSRRIGLGFMGLADLMYSIGIRYGSKEGQEFSAQLTEFIRYHAMVESINLARERGPFPEIKDSIYDPDNLVWQAPLPIEPYTKDFGRPAIDWSNIVDGIKRYGIRNAAQMCIAPTGTISTVAGVEGYGCEPVFALAYDRNVYQAAGDEDQLTLTYVSPMFVRALDRLGIKGDVRKRIVDLIVEKGSCRGISELPREMRETFVVSSDITPQEHILMQASIQAFVDNSISKTCNFPSTATKEDIAEAYMSGWELGCKGLTVYVTGTRKEVVLETQETKKKKNGKETLAEVAQRGYRLQGSTYKVSTPQGKAFVTVNRDEENNPREVFVNVGKAGTDVAALSEALGRLLSGWLRVSRNPLRTVREIVVQLIDIGGARRVGFGSNRVGSIPDAVAKVLAQEFNIPMNGSLSNDDYDEQVMIEDAKTASRADMCPDCGNSSLVQEEGCAKCHLCGYSVC